jgi:hypothetical protein
MFKVVPKFEANQMKKSTFILSIIIIIYPPPNIFNNIEKKKVLKMWHFSIVNSKIKLKEIF